jgi:hypothetical protein
MDFLDLPVAGFVLIDVPTGSVVATLRSADDLVETLREEQEDAPDRIWRLQVQAFDKTGVGVREMPAVELLSFV